MLRTRLMLVLGVSLLGVDLLTAGSPAFGQVTVDLHALQALPEHPGPSTAPRRVTPPSRMPQTEAPAARAPAPTATTTGPTTSPVLPTPPAPQPALPQNVPSVASVPPVPPPVEATPAPPPPTVSDTAPTKAEPESKGLRMLFGAGSADLSPDSLETLKQLAGAAPQNDSTSFNVVAYAPGSRDDPSTARRLSLSRAMAVRSALIGSGVPSARVYVRALGEAYGSGPPDRVDITVSGANADTAQAAPK